MKNLAPYSIPRNGLRGEWLLDGNAFDTNDGTKVNGTATSVTYTNTSIGYQKQNAVLNGTSSYVSMTFSHTGIMCIVASIKPTSTSASQCIFGGQSSGGLEFRVDAGGTLSLLRQNFANIGTSSGTISAGVWSQVIGIYNITTGAYEIYINGVLSGSGTNIQTISGNSYIGRQNLGEYFGGSIQSVRVYNRVLSNFEIKNLYIEHLGLLGLAGEPSLLDGLIGYLDLNDDANDVIGGFNGTIVGSPTLATDRLGTGKGYVLNGSSQAIQQIPAGFINWGSPNLTLGMWVKNNSDTSGAIFGSQNSTGSAGIVVEYGVSSAGKMLFYKGKASYIDGGNAIRLTYTFDNNWKFLVFCGDGSGIRAYIDGVIFGTGTNATNFDTPSVTSSYGNRLVGTTQQDYFNGTIGECFSFNRGLSADEVKKLYELTSKKYLYPYEKSSLLNLENGLVLNLQGDSSGTTYYDVSGSGNNATATGSPTIQRIQKFKSVVMNGTSRYLAAQNQTYGSALTNIVSFKKTAIGSAKYIFADSLSNSYKGVLYTDTSNRLLATFNNGTSYGTLTSTFTIVAGKWYRVGCTYDGTTFRLYINGKLEASSSAVTGSVRTDASLIRIGANATVFFDGSVANIKSYIRTLSSVEMQQDFYSSFIK